MNKNPANFVPLTPISFLHRTADIYGQRQAVVYENRSYTWYESRDRCVRMASSLSNMGVQKGDTVAVFAFNTPEMFESHFSVPMSGAILNTINVRDRKSTRLNSSHALISYAVFCLKKKKKKKKR